MNKRKSVTVVNFVSAAIFLFGTLGTGNSLAGTQSSTTAPGVTTSRKDGSIPGKRPGLTREELAKRSKEKGKIRREIIKRAQAGTILQK